MPLFYNLTQRDIGLEALYCQDFDDDSTYPFFYLPLCQRFHHLPLAKVRFPGSGSYSFTAFENLYQSTFGASHVVSVLLYTQQWIPAGRATRQDIQLDGIMRAS